MNVEEPGFRGPIEAAGAQLGCIHLSESDRGVPGRVALRRCSDDLTAGEPPCK